MEDKIIKRVNQAIEDKTFPGCVVGWIKNGKSHVLPFGSHTYDSDSQSVTEDSVYDVASITKSIPTATSLLTFIDSGDVSLEDKLSKFIPGFVNKEEVKIKHLLTYTLDLEIPKGADMMDKSADEIISIILKAKLRVTPGTKHFYTNVSAALMGSVVEAVSGSKLPKFAQDYFFEPLGMTKSTFYPLEKFSKEEIVPTEVVDWRGGLVQGEVHDESTYILQKGGYYLGAAGLFSTAVDLLKFTQMVLNKGSMNGERFLSENIIKEMEKDQIELPDAHVGLGWELNEPTRMGKYSEEIIGKSGFTGCMIMINDLKKASLVILSNRVHPKRPSDAIAMNSVRTEIANMVFSD